MSVAIVPGFDPRPAPQVGCPYCPHEDARIAELSRCLNEYQAREERRKKYDHLPNQTLSAKAARFAAHLDDLDRRWKTEGKSGPQCINVAKVSAELGFSKSAGRAALDELGIVGHSTISTGDPFPIKTKDGRTIEIEPILVEVLGKDPEELQRDPRGHGGRRCEYCGSEVGVKLTVTTERSIIRRTTRTTKVYCEGCGQHLSTSTMREDELVPAPKPVQENGVKTTYATELQIETSAVGDPSNSIELGTEGLNHLPYIDVLAEAAPTAIEIETSSSCAGESVVDLLCSIAGDDETHIEMKRIGAKYTTVPGAVTPALAQSHMAGDIMLGSTLRHAGGKARMLRWEEDTPEGVERLREAATALSSSGARPICEDSPSIDHPGGQHLMLVFDEVIDVASGQATALHWAPSLRNVEEHWPKGTARVRLPAGRYHRQDKDMVANAWCAVWPLGGQKRTEGAAFHLLLTHQTPAAWVTIAPPVSVEYRPRPSRPLNKQWLRPTEHVPKLQRDKKLTRFAAAMAGTTDMTEDAIIEELRRIVAECCEHVPDDPIKESSLVSKARSALRKFREGSGLQSGAYS